MVHELKVWIDYYKDIENGSKKFELRFNDRNFQVGDTLHLREYNHIDNYYTGKDVTKEVGYILDDTKFGLKDGWIVMGLI